MFGTWLEGGFWAILDQSLFAISNFALNLLLAHWLSPQDYGAFAAVFAVFLLIGTLHTGPLTEPMLVLGSGRYKNRLTEHLGTLLEGTIMAKRHLVIELIQRGSRFACIGQMDRAIGRARAALRTGKVRTFIRTVFVPSTRLRRLSPIVGF
jgi:hypothetical protein